MANGNCKHCGDPLGRINGRTLRLAANLDRITPVAPPVTEWAAICPTCQGPDLVSTHGAELPFCSADGVMRVGSDAGAGLVDLEDAMRAASGGSQALFATVVEAEGQRFLAAPSVEAALRFSELVCKWGRGMRVFGNLERHNDEQHGEALCRWLASVPGFEDDEQAVRQRSDSFPDGVPKGLGISFASKHLRMLDPSRFATLDDVLSQGLGFALNPKGYALFMSLLRKLDDQVRVPSAPRDLGRLEAGIFALVRQHVRSEGRGGGG